MFNDSQAFDPRWWAMTDETQIHSSLVSQLVYLFNSDSTRQRNYRYFAQMYGDTGYYNASTKSATKTPTSHKVTLNIVAIGVDFVTSRIGKQQPMPYPLTQGGNFTLRKKSKLLKKFLEAQYDVSKVWETTRPLFKDCCVFGTGVGKVFPHKDKIKVERVFPGDVLVDPIEALHGNPRQFYQRYWISKEVLEGLFPKKSRIIRESSFNLSEEHEFLPSSFHQYDHMKDFVAVAEGWYVDPDEKKGKHAIFTSAGVLTVEDYKEPVPPFVFLHWKSPLRGFWGIGIARELADTQTEINRMLFRIQKALQLVSVPRVFLNAASKINRKHITDEIGSYVYYIGEKPVFYTPSAMAPEYFSHLQWLYQRAFEIIGMSHDSATTTLGKGESGIARQTQHDVETDRFSIVAKEFERLSLEIGDRIIRAAKHIPNIGVAAKKDRFTIESIRWKDISMEEDEYTLRIMPASNLPTLPGHRIATITEMINSQLITPAKGKELLAFPDLEHDQALDVAAKENISRILEKILDDGELEFPEPEMDLMLAIKMAQTTINQFQGFVKQDEPNLAEEVEKRLDLLRLFMEKARELKQQADIEQAKLAMAAAAQNSPAPAPNTSAPPGPGPNGVPPTAIQATD